MVLHIPISTLQLFELSNEIVEFDTNTWFSIAMPGVEKVMTPFPIAHDALPMFEIIDRCQFELVEPSNRSTNSCPNDKLEIRETLQRTNRVFCFI